MTGQKKTFIRNALEQVKEDFAKPIAENTGKAMIDTFNPLAMGEKAMGSEHTDNLEKQQQEKLKKAYKNSTPLPIDKLNNLHDNEAKKKLEMEKLKREMFQYVKTGEKEAIEKRKQEEEERKKKFAQEEYEKKRQKEEQERQESMAGAPIGKIKKSILGGGKKKAQVDVTEIKPGKSKD